jgi:hypothetical protein
LTPSRPTKVELVTLTDATETGSLACRGANLLQEFADKVRRQGS